MAFTWPVRVYWEDTDAGGIVYYANYLKFFERARSEWLRALGLNQHALREQSGGMFVVCEAQLRYAQPARLDDLLHINVSLEHSGRVSLSMLQQAWRQPTPGQSEQTPTLLCQATVRLGWVDTQQLRPARIPDSVLTLLATP